MPVLEIEPTLERAAPREPESLSGDATQLQWSRHLRLELDALGRDVESRRFPEGLEALNAVEIESVVVNHGALGQFNDEAAGIESGGAGGSGLCAGTPYRLIFLNRSWRVD